MPSLKEIRTRIASIKSTRQITGAMKMVAASRLRKVQNKIIHLRSYEATLMSILKDVMLRLPPSYQNVYLRPRDNKDVLLICLGSDKGLCGTYNTLLIKRTLNELKNLVESGANPSVMPVGKKTLSFFEKREYDLCAAGDFKLDKVSGETATEFAKHLVKLFFSQNYGRMLVVYNRFRNAVVHEMTVEQVLPLHEDMLYKTVADEEIPDDPIILEPEAEEVIDYLTQQYIHFNVYRILLDASASEHGSRMTAMHQATDNADQMLKTLTLSYNKARQASVTRELLDIVGGGVQQTA